MADLYDRLEEMREILDILGGDVFRTKPLLGARDIQAAVSDVEEGARRTYVRAVFSFVEAMVEQHEASRHPPLRQLKPVTQEPPLDFDDDIPF